MHCDDRSIYFRCMKLWHKKTQHCYGVSFLYLLEKYWVLNIQSGYTNADDRSIFMNSFCHCSILHLYHMNSPKAFLKSLWYISRWVLIFWVLFSISCYAQKNHKILKGETFEIKFIIALSSLLLYLLYISLPSHVLISNSKQ